MCVTVRTCERFCPARGEHKESLFSKARHYAVYVSTIGSGIPPPPHLAARRILDTMVYNSIAKDYVMAKIPFFPCSVVYY